MKRGGLPAFTFGRCNGCAPEVLCCKRCPGLIDDFKDVAVHRLSKKESFKWRRTKRRKQDGAFGLESPLERFELGERIEHRDVASELVFECRYAEAFDIKDVHLLPAAQVEPHQLHR